MNRLSFPRFGWLSRCPRRWPRVQTALWTALTVVMGSPASRAAAPTSATQVLDDVRDFIGDAFDVGIWILVGGGYLVAAYMIIVGAYKFFTDRDGALAQFLLGVAVALGMVVLMTYFVTAGQTQLGNL